METTQTTSLRIPAFLYGLEEETLAQAMQEGVRCAEQYRREGTLPLPRDLVEVPAGELVVARDVVDFGWGLARWRLYSVSKVVDGLWNELPRENSRMADDLLEAAYRGTPWGALYFMLAHNAPQSAERESVRLQAVLRFWEPLRSVRYLYTTPGDSLSWEELMEEVCAWVLTAWSPEQQGGALRERLEQGAQRMARATREDCTEAILRQVPQALECAKQVKHREALADPQLWLERLAAMDPESFMEMSSAWTSTLLRKIYQWDEEFDVQ